MATCSSRATSMPSKRYPVLVYIYGEPASQTVEDRWGGPTRALSSSSRQPRLSRRQLRQCRYAGAARPRLAEGRLRRGRRVVVEAAGGGAAMARRQSRLRRSRSRRRVGMERWRHQHAEPDVPIARSVQGGHGGRARSRSAALRHDLPGTLHGPARRATPTATSRRRRSTSPRA